MSKVASLRDGIGFDALLAGAAFVFLFVFAGLPLFYNILMSVQNVDMFTLGELYRPFVGLQNYRDVTALSEFWLVSKNTIVFVVASILGQFVIGFALALLFLQKFMGAATIRGLFLVSYVMPNLVVGTIWSWIMAGDFGVLNALLSSTGIIEQSIYWRSDPSFSLWAVIIANIWLGIAFNMLLLSVGLAAIPKDLYEAAQLDGANAFARFFTITLPMMRSTIGAVLSLGFILTLQQFDLFAAMTRGGPANSSTVASYWAWEQSFQLYDFSKGATISVMLLIIVIIASLIYVRSTKHEVRG